MIEFRFSALTQSKPHEYAVRFLFGGCCTVVAGLIAKKYGPACAGLFLAFPAIFPAGASLVESHERKRKREIGADGTRRGRLAAAADSAGAALGCVALCVFALIIWLCLQRANAAFVISAASLAWLVAAVALWELRKRRCFARTRARRRQSTQRPR